MRHWKQSLSKGWLLILVLSLVFLAVACGTVAPPPEPLADPVEAPVVEGTPTPTPEAVAVPPEVEVHPGTLSIMVGDLSSERFDYVFVGGTGGGLNYGRLLHGFLVSDNEARDNVPGIASKWELSSDAQTWTWTIRKGVKFHDGSELTPQDVLWTLQHTFGPHASGYSAAVDVVRTSLETGTIELTGPDKVSLTNKKFAGELLTYINESE